MSIGGGGDTRIPLFPLSDVVHFPRTELKLHISEPRYRRLVRDVIENDEEARWIGIVLLKPGTRTDLAGQPEIFPGGTAGRLLDAEFLPDGCSNILLHGDFRFELRREVTNQPYRQALVHPVDEPWLNERDAGIVAVRGGIAALVRWLADELGERFPFGAGDAEELARRCPFEELVNRVAAELDLPPLRKLQLLQETLPERGLSVLSILRHRQQLVDQLRPYRHLAANSQLN
ncbi:MAG TPA: LON peptidase substrate-binding domain-containing protein [Thermoanaerobaculia bacterium]|nr:LON peptidase substrate-binding domain-containing protein [Thermoanaerobaculia bacterium]